MSSQSTPFDADGVSPAQRLEVLFEELSELAGQRNAIDGRTVEIVAELERDELCGATGARSITALVAWKTGVTPHNADTMVTVARRLDEFPLCADGLREGRLSLDQVGVIAEHAADGSDAHYAELAAVATVAQLRTAVKLEPRPEPEPEADAEAEPEPKRSFRKEVHDDYTTYQIVLPRLEAAKLDAGMQSHHEAQIAAWKRDHEMPTRSRSRRHPSRMLWTRSWVWSRRGGMLMWRPARTGSTPPSSCTLISIQMARNPSQPCIWARCSPTRRGAT
jgi:hypothetical protein